ncbi:MAG: META domain-containing protein [Psychromonas sp.]
MKLAQVVIVSLSTLLFSCASEPTAEIAKQPLQLQVLSQQWTLLTVDDNPITINSSLQVDQQGAASGNLACNNFVGKVELQANKLRIEQMVNTRKLCLPEISLLERQVASTLVNWSEVQINDKKLILTGEEYTLVYTIK